MTPSEFQFLGIPHIVAMILTVAIPVVLAVLVRKVDAPKVTRAVCYLLGATLLTNDAVHWVYRIAPRSRAAFKLAGRGGSSGVFLSRQDPWLNDSNGSVP